MNVALMTHRGAVRAENQDALCVAGTNGPWTFWVGDMAGPEVLEVNGYPLLLAVVDGMGGHKGGARAARILAEALTVGYKDIFDARFDPEADRRALRSLLEKAALRMEADAGRSPEFAGMGATVAGVLIREKNALVFNCGDCRVYRFSAGELERLTRDHSVVEMLYEQGEIDENEMRTHPKKNIVTSAVSALGDNFELYAGGVSRCEEDVFFLCSDGVWEALDAGQLARWLARPFPEAADGLFKSLLAAGCRDNVSFLWQAR